MQQQNLPSSFSMANDSDEIDLIEVLFSLWRRKWTIIITTTIFLAISLGYALLAPQVWTSKAVVMKPSTFLIGDYLKIIEKYDTLQNQNPNDNQAQNTNRTQQRAQRLFNIFALNLVNQNNQIQFLKTTPMYQELLDKGLSHEKAMDILLRRLTIAKADKDKMPVDIDALDISFQAKNPALAQKTLQDFIQYVNDQTKVTVSKNTFTQGEVRLLALRTEIHNIESHLKALHEERLTNLMTALQTAENAKIIDFNYSQGYTHNSKMPGFGSLQITADTVYNGPFLFMLGTNYLKAQIATFKKQAIVYPQRYYQLKDMAQGLQEILTDTAQAKYQTYSYLDLPSYPESRTKPKRSLIVIGGTLGGSILGVLLALFLNAVSAFRLREKQQMK